MQFTRNGESCVIEAGTEFAVLSHNAPIEGDTTAFSASTAIRDGSLFVRSEGWLYSFGGGAEGAPSTAGGEVSSAR